MKISCYLQLTEIISLLTRHHLDVQKYLSFQIHWRNFFWNYFNYIVFVKWKNSRHWLEMVENLRCYFDFKIWNIEYYLSFNIVEYSKFTPTRLENAVMINALKYVICKICNHFQYVSWLHLIKLIIQAKVPNLTCWFARFLTILCVKTLFLDNFTA